MIGPILSFILGLCIGSFLNVCIYRLPKEISLVKPSSFCPNCKAPIKWYDNIPLLSYLILGGRCRSCKEKISFRYFLVELLTGAVFLFSYLKLGLSLVFFKYIVLFSLCIVVSFIDIDYRAIPGWICIFGILLGLIFSLVESFLFLKSQGLINFSLSRIPLVKSFLGLFLCIGLSYFLKLMGDFFLWIWLALRKKESIEGEREALGLGDVDFLGMVGAFLGWKLGFLVFFLAPIVALVYGIYIIVFKKSHLIAYLPFLAIAVFIVSFWGEKIINLFFSL
ncbi:MAG TPA: prepilin peptidase [Candidatus Omnitrophica bacterium]|nr:MAG: prepilin peptidase [Candidatus Omnitrophota bacterium]RKY35509.1 MAG: prepilin peptidase [Candidatus Omnitrophota bacterium]RKY45052.1 MAG: prepilin peptidase [Candidatus Omnitrophota bacterium]HEC69737.1 prepilin peptidase [Candidatus Omnitrophota bacterium]